VIEAVRGDIDRTASVLTGWLSETAPVPQPAQQKGPK
jgi:hypothetical protein